MDAVVEEAPDTQSNSSSRSRRVKDTELCEARIGFLGAGKMTESIVHGLIKYGSINPEKIHVAAPSSKNLQKFKEMGCHVTKRNIDIFGRYACDIVFLAFHGKVIADAFAHGGTRPHPITVNFIPNLRKPLHILSLVSGHDLEAVKKVLLNPENPKKYQLEMHRVAVNLAVAHGVGLCAVDCDPESQRLSPLVRSLLSSVGELIHVSDAQIDSACALINSGLAFSYYYFQAIMDGSVKLGLTRPLALKVAAKVLESATQSLMESGKNPNELRDHVSSAGGAAVYGLHVMDKAEVASGITAGVESAYKRDQELAK